MNTLQSGTRKAPKEQLARHFVYMFGSDATPDDFKAHRNGKKEIRLYVKDGYCGFGWIKLKTNGVPFDAMAMANRIKELQLPLLVLIPKSGEGMLWWFGKGQGLGQVRELLEYCAAKLKLQSAEIFPAADAAMTFKGTEIVPAVNTEMPTGAPYFGDDRIEILVDGSKATCTQFVNHAMALREEQANFEAEYAGTRDDDSGPRVSDESAALILEPFWSPTSRLRDEIGTAVASILMRRGVPEERVNWIIRYVGVKTQDEELDARLHSRSGIVAKVRRAIVKGTHLPGIPRLKEHIGNIPVERFLEACGLTQFVDKQALEDEETEESRPIKVLCFTLEELEPA